MAPRNGTRSDQPAANCLLCKRPMYYINWGAGLLTLHEENGNFLCPDDKKEK